SRRRHVSAASLGFAGSVAGSVRAIAWPCCLVAVALWLGASTTRSRPAKSSGAAGTADGASRSTARVVARLRADARPGALLDQLTADLAPGSVVRVGGVAGGWLALDLPREIGMETAVAWLRGRPDVEAAEPDYRFAPLGTPNDPLFATDQTYLRAVHAP